MTMDNAKLRRILEHVRRWSNEAANVCFLMSAVQQKIYASIKDRYAEKIAEDPDFGLRISPTQFRQQCVQAEAACVFESIDRFCWALREFEQQDWPDIIGTNHAVTLNTAVHRTADALAYTRRWLESGEINEIPLESQWDHTIEDMEAALPRGRALEELERPRAKARKDSTLKQGDKSRSDKFPEREKGETRDKVGAAISFAPVADEPIVEAAAVVDSSKPEMPIEYYVTLDQSAALVSRSKSTLRNYKGKGLPTPTIKGGGRGKPDEWLWPGEIKPWLEEEFGRNLPDIPPGCKRIETD